jgi:lipopolysaccharide biosynthesis protein
MNLIRIFYPNRDGPSPILPSAKFRVKLLAPSNARLQYTCGIIHFEGEIFHDGKTPPASVFLKIGKRKIRLRRIKQNTEKTHFLARFTMRTGIKLLHLYTQNADAPPMRLWSGITLYRKKQPALSFPPPLPALPELLPLPRQTENTAPRIGVVLHLHYVDLWPEFSAYLSQIPEAFDLHVTLSPSPAKTFDAMKNVIQSCFPGAQVYPVENRGRDILPFLSVFQKIPPKQYQYLCKIHAKKAIHRWWADGDFWRRNLLADMLGSRQITASILQRFDADPSLGILVPWNNLQHWTPASHDPNREAVVSLATRMGIRETSDYTFPSGAMFWARVSALEPLRLANIRAEEFPEESSQEDGTMAHAVERAFGLSVQGAGFNSEETVEVRE